MTYPGGKSGSGVYQKLINLMPPHQVYVEPFLGGGAIMRIKRPAMTSIAIDVDGEAVSDFRHTCNIPGLTLLRTDALGWLRNATNFDSPDSLIYLDPPYLMSTRSAGRAIYRHEFATEAEHRELLVLIRGLRCMVMISGYYSDLYAEVLHDWRLVQFQAQTRGGPATECVWLNFPPPVELHDCRFLGNDFRERERINRKKRRWSERLKSMDPLERQALLSAIDELRDLASPNR